MNNIATENIKHILKENLKCTSLIKETVLLISNSIESINIDYKPYYQRNYVWDDKKASYFIESILMGTEIPPIVLFKYKNIKEVIDGRQRYETLKNFNEDKLTLNGQGLTFLSHLKGKKFKDLSAKDKETFVESTIRVIEYSIINEDSVTGDYLIYGM